MEKKDIRNLFDNEVQELKTRCGYLFGNTKYYDQAMTDLNLTTLKIEQTNRRALARASVVTKEITIFDTNQEDMYEVIVHELMHILSFAVFQRQIGHSKEYKDLGTELGYERSIFNATRQRTVPMDIGTTKEIQYKYRVVCADCGSVLARYKTKAGKLKATADPKQTRYKCGFCHSSNLKIENI